MNRTIGTVAGVLSASSLLLVDSAVKGTVLLAVAAAAALMLRRDSAATRHLVWLMAIAAMLVVPLLSAMLPQWRVLPAWMNSTIPVVTDVSLPSIDKSTIGSIESSEMTSPAEVERPSATFNQRAAAPAISQPALVTAVTAPTTAARSWNWIDALPLVWVIGFTLLILRLSAARWLLWNSERLATVVGRRVAPPLVAESRSKSEAAQDPILMAMATICSQLGIGHPVTLMIHPNKTIPVVWGILRCRLMLPAAARQWSDEQLRSVLLHELAHVKRRDSIVQLLAQVACALHWFNPLVWFAVWRLDVERERACDDLVLASGIRPSAYAGHLLDVVTGLSPARWTQSCGLAMARTSSLEGRLTAVLGKDLNRRDVSVAIAGLALAIAVGIAVPIAMLRAAPVNPPAPSDGSPDYDWGEPTNGLRGAVVIRAPKPGAATGIFLALQNVSDAALHVSDSMAAKEQRKLYLSDSSGILMALTSSQSTKTDVVLPPREVLFLPMFPADEEKVGEAALIEGLRKDSLQSWRAVLEINNASDGVWNGKLSTADTRCTALEGPQPKSKEGRALIKLWQDSARLNGDIPGGLVRLLHDKVKEFIRANTGDVAGDPYAKKMAPLEPRFGVAGDWKRADVVALFDDIAAVTTVPLETTMAHLTQRRLQHGQPLPASLEKADWGDPLPSGLRMAYLLEPRAAEYPLGTEVKARIILHNSGKEPVAFIAGSFQQPGHKAKRADGSELKLDATDWLTRSVPQAYRLAPDEYMELNTPGLGIGANQKDRDDWSEVRAGSWILCGRGDEVTLLPGGIMLSGDGSALDGEPRPWWPEFISERLSREAPVPLDTKERAYQLYRVVRDLFGTAPSTTEGDAFAADKSPDALKNLAALLAKHSYGKQSQGIIHPGETKFRVLAPDPDAAKKPRVVTNPGRYKLGDEVRLVITRREQRARVINDGSVTYYPPGRDNIAHDLKFPDGYDTWAAGWEPGSTILWVSQKGLLRKLDFTSPAKVEETRYEGTQTDTAPLPADLRKALSTAVSPDAPVQQPKRIQEPPAATAAPAAELPRQRAKITREMLEGIWLGERDGVKFEIRFRWYNEHQQASWRVWKEGFNLGLDTSVVLDADAARLIFRKGDEFEHSYGRLTVGEGGTLSLDLTPNPHVKDQPVIMSQKGIVLTRQPDEARRAPKQQGAQTKERPRSI